MAKNCSVSARDSGSVPDLGTSHMPRSNSARDGAHVRQRLEPELHIERSTAVRSLGIAANSPAAPTPATRESPQAAPKAQRSHGHTP